jgi:hypothetical protein
MIMKSPFFFLCHFHFPGRFLHVPVCGDSGSGHNDDNQHDPDFIAHAQLFS